MNHYKIANDLFDNGVQIGEIFWLAGVDRAEPLPRGLEDLFDDATISELTKLFKLKPGLLKRRLKDYDGAEEGTEEFTQAVLDILMHERVLGFLVEVRFPYIVEAFPDGMTKCCGTSCKILYTEALDEVLVAQAMLAHDEYRRGKIREAKRKAKKEAVAK